MDVCRNIPDLFDQHDAKCYDQMAYCTLCQSSIKNMILLRFLLMLFIGLIRNEKIY